MNGSGRMEGRVLFLGVEAAWRFVLYHVFYKQPAPRSKVLKKGQKKGALNQNCVLCSDPAMSHSLFNLNPESALNTGTTILFPRFEGPFKNAFCNCLSVFFNQEIGVKRFNRIFPWGSRLKVCWVFLVGEEEECVCTAF